MDNSVIKTLLDCELARQNSGIELIASENYPSKNILEACGSIAMDKYAEGYPDKRYYGGCEFIDEIEKYAIKHATQLFNVKYANVQPHSGSQANAAAYHALMPNGGKVLSLVLNDGGHLTHGSPVSFSSQQYEFVHYPLGVDGKIDYDLVQDCALKFRPNVILTGYSAYPFKIDFKKFKEIADSIGAYLMVDMAHIAGLVAAGLHPSPVSYAHVVTTTTHKTLRGPRGGLILTNDAEIAKKINKAVFPGIQGGPLMHVIAAKAECFYEAMQPEFKEYQMQVLKNIKTLSETLSNEGFRIISGGTDNHLILVDVKSTCGLTGKEAQNLLDRIHITTNKNTIPNDSESPMVTSGLRLGSPAMTTRGLKESDFEQIGLIISKALKNSDNDEVLNNLEKEVLEITSKYPLWY